MTSPFRSTVSLASRRKTRPVVERATFVIVSLGAMRWAIPVEVVERVLRVADADQEVRWNDRVLPWADLSAGEWARQAEFDPQRHRVLVVRGEQSGAHGHCWAVPVHAVHEVYAIEAALLEPSTRDDTADRSLPGLAVRATFERQGHRVYVIDVLRSLTARP